MKQTIKSILKSFDWYKKLQQIYINRERRKYEKVKVCKLSYQGINIKFDTSDSYSNKWFYPRFAWGKIHEPGATKVFFDHVLLDSNVFDIGGHLGYFSCIAGELSKTGTVCVFEVDANCIDIIGKNAKLNDLTNIKVFNMAISDSSGFVSIPILKKPDPGTRIESSKDKNHINVPTITIDEFIQKEGIVPNFIKIDVEGAEYKVLKGMTKLLRNKDITLLVEVHVRQLSKYFNTDYRDVLKFLSDQGFNMEILESHRSKTGSLRAIDYTETLFKNEMILCKK